MNRKARTMFIGQNSKMSGDKARKHKHLTVTKSEQADEPKEQQEKTDKKEHHHHDDREGSDGEEADDGDMCANRPNSFYEMHQKIFGLIPT